MTVPPAPARANRRTARGSVWVRTAAEKVPTKWLTTAGAAVVLLATAAFGGLADAPDRTPMVGLGDVIETPGLTLTPIDAEILPANELIPDTTFVRLTFDVLVTGDLPLRITQNNQPPVVTSVFAARSRAAADLDSAVDVLIRPDESAAVDTGSITDADRDWANPLFAASAQLGEVRFEDVVTYASTLQPGILYRVSVDYKFAKTFTSGSAEIVVWNRDLAPGSGVTESRAEKVSRRTTEAAQLTVPLRLAETL
ncbi:hypothetical protein [Microbacterium gorillae]|uniref:hypothetical protein n=1 Tax=Microbacterium gorillae TaxID=1231063 RepID=UPI003D97DBB8